jgi:hypothetical protein
MQDARPLKIVILGDKRETGTRRVLPNDTVASDLSNIYPDSGHVSERGSSAAKARLARMASQRSAGSP